MDTLKCDPCQSEFFSKATKSIHDMMYHDMPKTESFLCKHCSEVAGSLYEIVRHHQGSDFVFLNFLSILLDFLSQEKHQFCQTAKWIFRQKNNKRFVILYSNQKFSMQRFLT